MGETFVKLKFVQASTASLVLYFEEKNNFSSTSFSKVDSNFRTRLVEQVAELSTERVNISLMPSQR